MQGNIVNSHFYLFILKLNLTTFTIKSNILLVTALHFMNFEKLTFNNLIPHPSISKFNNNKIYLSLQFVFLLELIYSKWELPKIYQYLQRMSWWNYCRT